MPKTRVLIVDDFQIARRLVRKILGEADFAYFEVSDGDEALNILCHERIDLILLDQHMPGKSGLDLIELKNKIPNCAAVPVIMITAARSDSLVERGNDLGVLAWITKPIRPNDLLSAVQHVLLRKAS